MSETTQQNRLMAINTPLGEDYLLINRLWATEEISALFSIEVELLKDEGDERDFEPTVVDVKAILGQEVSIDINQRDGTARTLSGIVNRFSQRQRDRRFTYYYATIVPNIWVLTQISQSRIFQHKSVPDILKEVFNGFVASYELQGEYKPRNYCVQYRETDFDFASRLMEEEGIYYYFEHEAGKNRLVVADTPQSHRDCPSKHEVPFALKVTEEDDFIASIRRWQDDYSLQTGKVTFWDFNFQVPTNKLDATQPSLFKVADNEKLEFYEYPGGYARKFDDVDRSGGKRSDVQNVFGDKTRKAEIAMQALDAQYRVIIGGGDCSSLSAGHRFKFFNHPSAAQNGQYVVTSMTHEAAQSPMYESETEIETPYSNSFRCAPQGAGSPPFRPARKTPKPIVQGSQTAIVVGPAGEEIFTDPYGRVKVQFPWDRASKGDSDSSCWVRVAQSWAGSGWGMVFIPRIGMEVIVHFLEGDPDQPIITGCVYNAMSMPPYKLPDEKTKMSIKSNSTPNKNGFNELRFEDKKDAEQIFIHAERDYHVRTKNDRFEWTGADQHLMVRKTRYEEIDIDSHLTVKRDQIEEIRRNRHVLVKADEAIKINANQSIAVGGDAGEEVKGNKSVEVTKDLYLKGKNVVIEATATLTIKTPGGFVTIGASGVDIKGGLVNINSGGAAGSGAAGKLASPMAAKAAIVADDALPGTKNSIEKRSAGRKEPTHKEGDETKKSWIAVKVVDEAGEPVPSVRFRVKTPDGRFSSGATNKKGEAKISNIDPGNCEIEFPGLDAEAWEEA